MKLTAPYIEFQALQGRVYTKRWETNSMWDRPLQVLRQVDLPSIEQLSRHAAPTLATKAQLMHMGALHFLSTVYTMADTPACSPSLMHTVMLKRQGNAVNIPF